MIRALGAGVRILPQFSTIQVSGLTELMADSTRNRTGGGETHRNTYAFRSAVGNAQSGLSCVSIAGGTGPAACFLIVQFFLPQYFKQSPGRKSLLNMLTITVVPPASFLLCGNTMSLFSLRQCLLRPQRKLRISTGLAQRLLVLHIQETVFFSVLAFLCLFSSANAKTARAKNSQAEMVPPHDFDVSGLDLTAGWVVKIPGPAF